MIFYKDRWLRAGGRFRDVWMRAHGLEAAPAEREHLVDVCADLSVLLHPTPRQPVTSLRLTSTLLNGTVRRASDLADELLENASGLLNEIDGVTSNTVQEGSGISDNNSDTISSDESIYNYDETTKSNNFQCIQDDLERSEDHVEEEGSNRSYEENSSTENDAASINRNVIWDQDIQYNKIYKKSPVIETKLKMRSQRNTIPRQQFSQRQSSEEQCTSAIQTSPVIGKSYQIFRIPSPEHPYSQILPLVQRRYTSLIQISPTTGRYFHAPLCEFIPINGRGTHPHHDALADSVDIDSSTAVTAHQQINYYRSYGSDVQRIHPLQITQSPLCRIAQELKIEAEIAEMQPSRFIVGEIPEDVANICEAPGENNIGVLSDVERSRVTEIAAPVSPIFPHMPQRAVIQYGSTPDAILGNISSPSSTRTLSDHIDEMLSIQTDAGYSDRTTNEEGPTRMQSVSLPLGVRGLVTVPATRKRKVLGGYYGGKRMRITRTLPPVTRSQARISGRHVDEVPLPARNIKRQHSTHRETQDSIRTPSPIPLNPETDHLSESSIVDNYALARSKHSSSHSDVQISTRRETVEGTETLTEENRPSLECGQRSSENVEDQEMRGFSGTDINMSIEDASMARSTLEANERSHGTPPPEDCNITLPVLSTSNSMELLQDEIWVEIHEPPSHAFESPPLWTRPVGRMSRSSDHRPSSVFNLREDEELELTSSHYTGKIQSSIYKQMMEADSTTSDDTVIEDDIDEIENEDDIDIDEPNTPRVLSKTNEFEITYGATPRICESEYTFPRRQKLSDIMELSENCNSVEAQEEILEDRHVNESENDDEQVDEISKEYIEQDTDDTNTSNGHSDNEMGNVIEISTDREVEKIMQSTHAERDYELRTNINAKDKEDGTSSDDESTEYSDVSLTSLGLDTRIDIFPRGRIIDSRHNMFVFRKLSDCDSHLIRGVKIYLKSKEHSLEPS